MAGKVLRWVKRKNCYVLSSYETADRLAGFRLDRRSNYFIDRYDGSLQVLQEGYWTTGCSGCSCDCGCYGGHGAAGCSECGYTGKRRMYFQVPVELKREAAP